MSFDKDAVGSDSYSGFSDGLDQLRLSAGHPATLVRLLQRMSNIDNDRTLTFLLHDLDSSIVDH